MRLIDGDALSKKLLEELHNRSMQGFGKGLMIANSCVINAPTIEPEHKKGRWEIYVISMLDGEGCRCSECSAEGAPYWDFCPNCGAEMTEGES